MDVAPGGWRYAMAVLAGGLPVAVLVPGGGLVALVLAAAVVYFHRDPERVVGDGVVAPADGRISVIREEGDHLRVGVYMSATDVHVNRAPLRGRVVAVEHRDGANRLAFSKDSDRNERVRIEFAEPTYAMELIAGAFARRIHPYVDPDDRVARGTRVGHVSFGSRADVILPTDVTQSDLAVTVGDRVRAGETTLAHR